MKASRFRSSPGRASTLLGALLALAGIGFVVRALARDVPQVMEALPGVELSWLLAALLLGLCGMTLIGLGWRRALALTGRPLSRGAVLRWYFVGQLAKYLPGGIWAVVGSAELARGDGTSRSHGYGAMLLALGACYLAGIFTVVGLLALDPGVLPRLPAVGVLVALVPLGVIAVHPTVLGTLLSLANRISRQPIELQVPRWGASCLLVLRHVPAWFVLGLASWCVVRALGFAPPVTNILAAATLAWVVGFLVVPAPGGVGVREAVFVMAATSLPSGVAALVAILARLLFIVVDVAAAGLALAGRPQGVTPAASPDDAASGSR